MSFPISSKSPRAIDVFPPSARITNETRIHISDLTGKIKEEYAKSEETAETPAAIATISIESASLKEYRSFSLGAAESLKSPFALYKLPLRHDLILDGFTEKTADELSLLHGSDMSHYSLDYEELFDESGRKLNQILREEFPDLFNKIIVSIDGPVSNGACEISVEKSPKGDSVQLRFHLNSIFVRSDQNFFTLCLYDDV